MRLRIDPEVRAGGSTPVSKKLLSIVVAAWAISCTSCGNSSGLYPVTGSVTYRGEPATGASVTFVKKGAADPARDRIAQGTVAEDGTFALEGPAGAGLPPGEYAVLVEWKEGAGTKKGRSPGLSAPDRLKRKYLDSTKPLLSATVEAKSNRLAPFELQ